MNVEELKRLAHVWIMQSRKVVFTNGVFDLMHKGHVDYLMKAADLGDRLVIGLNSDESVKLLNKGSNRPIQDEDSRALILASMSFVRAVVIFDEETPANLIEALSPNVLVKGGDYKIEDIAGSDYVLSNGGNVITIPLVEGYSTSNIEARIKNS
jgi:rfaE bifunctional protein nucleotidyltransferase chain/domain